VKEMNAKKNLMGYSYILWLCGKLVKEKGYKLDMEEAEYQIYNESAGEWIKKSGERIILRAPKGWNKDAPYNYKDKTGVWDITTFLTERYDGRTDLLGNVEYGKEVDGRLDMGKFWKDVVYQIAEEADTDINDVPFLELEPEDGVDRDAMKVLIAYVEEQTKKRKAEEGAKQSKPGAKRSGQSGSTREENIKAILLKNMKATLPVIAEELKKLGDTGAGGKTLSPSTLSPIVNKVKASMTELEGEGLRMCGV
jgi:hypothetical protein